MKKIYSTVLLSVGLLASSLTAQTISCFNCGTGSNGAYTASANTTLAGGTYNYTSFTINSGVTVSVTGTQPLIIRCSGAVVINGLLIANGGNGTNGITSSSGGIGGTGVAGGQNGGNGNYSVSSGALPGTPGNGAGGVGTGGGAWSGGGGAGFSAVGSSSGNSGGGFGGPVYGDAQLSAVLGGSGGGGGSGGFSCGSGGGGAGGGYIEISACTSLTIGNAGGIFCNGGNGGSDGTGNCGGGGAGSGGAVWLGAPSIVNNGQVRALGGIGGASAVSGPPYFGGGGNGAVGRIRVDGNLTGTGTIVPSNVYSGSLLQAAASNNTAICAGSSTTITGSATGGVGTYSYLWMPGSLTTASITVSPTLTTTYTLTVTDGNNCTSTTSVIVTVNNLPIVGLSGSTTICSNTSGTLLSGSSGGTSQWYLNGQPIVGANSNTYFATQAGVYNMTKTNLNGCVDSSATGLTVTLAAAPSVDLGNDTSYCSGSLLLDAQGPGITSYLWNDATNGSTLTVSSSGNYSVAVTNAAGCSANDTIAITIFGNPAVTVTPAVNGACLADAVVILTGAPAGGTFSGPGVSGNTFDPNTAGIGTHTIQYVYTDSNGCSASASDTILVDICLGIASATTSIEANIFPNPSSGTFMLNVNDNATVEIFNTLGERVYSTTIKANAAQEINLNGQAKGLYLIRLTTERGIMDKTIVIQ